LKSKRIALWQAYGILATKVARYVEKCLY